MKPFVLAIFAALVVYSAQAAGAVVDADFVADAIKRGAILWDVRGSEAYRRGHIPSAVNIGNIGHVLRNPNTEDFVPVRDIELILGSAGIDPQKEIVVYADRGNPYAYFGHFTIRYFGGRSAYVFHEGIDGWRASGRTLSTEPQRLPPAALRLTPRPEVSATTDQVVAALNRPDTQIIDARTPDEYSGNDIRAIRGGHIPGAVNIPYEMNWSDPDAQMKLAMKHVKDTEGMKLKSRVELERLYAGLDRNKQTIVYCQSGVRAAQTATVLSELGFSNVKVYDSSWLGYASRLSAPASNEVFFNVGLLQARIGALQARIDQLERELAATRTRE